MTKKDLTKVLDILKHDADLAKKAIADIKRILKDKKLFPAERIKKLEALDAMVEKKRKAAFGEYQKLIKKAESILTKMKKQGLSVKSFENRLKSLKKIYS